MSEQDFHIGVHHNTNISDLFIYEIEKLLDYIGKIKNDRIGSKSLVLFDDNGIERIQVSMDSACIPFFGTIDGMYCCDINLNEYLVFYKYFNDTLTTSVNNIDRDLTRKARTKLNIDTIPLQYPEIVRICKGNEHRLTLIECMDGDGWDLATPEGEVVYCGISDIVANQISTNMVTTTVSTQVN